MGDLSRRKFLARAGLGVAVAAAGASMGAAGIVGGKTLKEAAGAKRPAPRLNSAGGGDEIVAHVSSYMNGEVTVFAGTRETVIIDRDLVERLARASVAR